MAAPRNQSDKRNRNTRAINLEQLENRMMCTINGLEQSLLLLNGPLAVPSTSAPPISVQANNTAPQITTPINSSGNTNTTTSGKSITLSVVASDDGGARGLKYAWQVTQAPNGATTKFSKNNNATAATTVFSFSQVGTYQLRLTVTDAAGLAVTTTQTVTVVPQISRLELQSTGNTVASAGRSIKTSNASASLVAVAFDQFGLRMTTPTVTWRSTSVAPGGTATITSETGGASIAFNKSGNYGFEATASTITLKFSIAVSQTLTSVAVTPGTSSLTTGQSQQFSAVARDQFQLPMAKQPLFTWTATGGTISGSGAFTAPNAAGNFTIRATSGSLSAQATVAVAAPAPANGLQDAALSGLMQTFFADGSVTRPEMIQLLRAAGINGSIDATELSDLRYVVSNANTFNIADYVKVLASNVVNTNLANSLYQGAAAGNLVAGSSATLLNNLVDKWFLGTDRPTLTSGSFSYRAASGSLFVGAPAYANEKQGMLGDCYFIAALGSLGVSNADAVRNMFVDNGDGTYTIRFYGGSYGAYYNADGSIGEGFANGVGVADYVTVDRMLPSTSSGMFVYSNYGASLSNTGNVLWIALAEKAYAQWNATGKSNRTPANTYASIEGGWMSYVNAQVLGYNSTRYASSNAANKTALINALTAGRAVTVGTTGNSSMMVSSHAYSITGYNASTDKFTIFNPWGTQHPAPMSWAELQANTTFFIVANPAQSVPIFSSASGGIASVRTSGGTTFIVGIPTASVTSVAVADSVTRSESHAQQRDTALIELDESASVDALVATTSIENNESSESSFANIEEAENTSVREAVDMLFAVDQLENLLNELSLS